MDEVTENELILLDIAKIWGSIEDRTKNFIASMIVEDNEIVLFHDIMEELHEEVKLINKYVN